MVERWGGGGGGGGRGCAGKKKKKNWRTYKGEHGLIQQQQKYAKVHRSQNITEKKSWKKV